MDNTSQVYLTDKARSLLVVASENIKAVVPANKTPEGVAYWVNVTNKLDAMAEHGTADGKPAVSDEEQAAAEVIDDKWATVWPRRWVMVRNDGGTWIGPKQLGTVTTPGRYRYVMTDGSVWTTCRPAADKEVATKVMSPVIGEGYREATEADKNRQDRDYWNKGYGQWREACTGVYSADATYRVPIDREPTEEDASVRRTVMVRDNQEDPWVPRTLIAVLTEADNAEFPFVAARRGCTTAAWQYARRLYPGEDVLSPE